LDTHAHLATVDTYAAHNYAPLPVVVAHAQGVWVTDVEGRRFLDLLSAYSALSFGHRHPRLLEAARRQLERVTLTSRAFHNDQLGPLCEELADLCGFDVVLPMNTGAEAVETAVKTARKWGYERKGVRPGRAKIVVADGNFHGRTTTIISFSSDELARAGFGPYTPGFEVVPYGDAEALRAAIDEDTVAFLVEPIQGERGVVLPPDGYLRAVREICSRTGVLFIADEIQSGLGRTGKLLAVDHEQVRPDVLVLGKALGGGIYPVSAVLASREVMAVHRPGTHGSTFGGNPLAAALAREVVAMLREGTYQRSSAALGAHLLARLRGAALGRVTELRGRGLWVGIDLDVSLEARKASEALLERGVLCKETHETTLRIAPPLSITREELDWGIDRLVDVLR
jgi:ornithine--oxo-acid transaminase